MALKGLRVGVGLLFMAAGSSVMAAPADDLKLLLEQGKPAEAYQSGKGAPEQLGNPVFDFYFGIAALDAGVPGEGVLALERYLLQFPDNRSGRFHLARGYYILGEDQRSRSEFSELLAGADETERLIINKYLDAIRARESRYNPTATGFVEFGLGLDSNINGGVRSGQVAGLPAGVVVLPGQSSAKDGDWFKSIAAGVQGTYPVSPGFSLYGGASVTGRWNGEKRNDVFDQTILSLQGGAALLEGRHLFRAGVDYSSIGVDNQNYLNIFGLVGEWQYQANQFNRFGLAGQWSQLRYENINVFLDKAKTIPLASGATVRDSDLWNIAGMWTHTMNHAWAPVFSASVNLGQEINQKGRPDLSRDIWGVKAGVTFQPLPKWSVGGGLAYQDSRYQRPYAPGIQSPRKDGYYSLEASATYALDRNWSVRGEYQYSHQDSNVGFYEYDRNMVALKLRYDFK